MAIFLNIHISWKLHLAIVSVGRTNSISIVCSCHNKLAWRNGFSSREKKEKGTWSQWGDGLLKAVLSNGAKEREPGIINEDRRIAYLCSFSPPCPEQSRCCSGTWSCRSCSCTSRRCTSQERLCTRWYLKAEQTGADSCLVEKLQAHPF